MSDVVVVAVGARTPIGLTAESSAAAVRGGISRIREHPFMIDVAGAPLMAATDSRLDPTLLGWKRLVALATSALLEATNKGFAAPGPSHGLMVLLTLPESRPGFTSADAQSVLRRVHEAIEPVHPGTQVVLAGAGHAGTLQSVATAIAHLRAGRCQVAAVGGADSYLEADTLDALASRKRVAAEGIRSGFHPGEGAGFLLLTLSATAQRLGLPSLAKVRGAFAAMEERSFDKGVEVLGHGLAAAISGAASGLRLPGEPVDTVFCDINGERYRSQEWGMTVLRVQRVLKSAAYEAPSDLWGDVGAAWGALGCVLAVQSWARRYAKGPRALVWGSSDGGLRGAVTLEQPAGS